MMINMVISLDEVFEESLLFSLPFFYDFFKNCPEVVILYDVFLV
jgi:hypothetical protein